MSDPIKRLRQLIGKYATEEGCTRAQIEQIVALVDEMVESGVPGDSAEIERKLRRIGGGS